MWHDNRELRASNSAGLIAFYSLLDSGSPKYSKPSAIPSDLIYFVLSLILAQQPQDIDRMKLPVVGVQGAMDQIGRWFSPI